MGYIVNVYSEGGVWFYALWVGAEYDHSGVLEAQTKGQAQAEVLAVWPDADVRVLPEGGR